MSTGNGVVDNPPLGATVVHGQPLGAVEGDPGHGAVGRQFNMVVVIDSLSRAVGYSMALASENPVPSAERRVVEPWQHMVYWGKAFANVSIRGSGQFLPYPPDDGIPISTTLDPVNPYGIGPQWLNVLSRFAHDLMEFNPHTNHLRDSGTHATGHLPPSDAATQLKNKMTYQLGRAVVGVAWNRIKHWLTLDAEKLALFPATVTDRENWEIWQDGRIPNYSDEIPIPNLNAMMSMICGDDVTNVKGLCVGAWVYLLNHRIDASSFDANMNSSGEIRLPDMSRETWHPNLYLHRVTGTRSERSDQWDEIMGWFRDAHDHYLENVAPGIEH